MFIIARYRSVEVLKIIAKVLAFDDEQLIAVGLKVPNIDIFATILNTVIGKPAAPPDVEVKYVPYFCTIFLLCFCGLLCFVAYSPFTRDIGVCITFVTQRAVRVLTYINDRFT